MKDYLLPCLCIDKVKDSLSNGVSGIKFNQEYSDLGMRSHVSGSVKIDLTELIDRKLMRFMSKAAALDINLISFLSINSVRSIFTDPDT